MNGREFEISLLSIAALIDGCSVDKVIHTKRVNAITDDWN